MVEQHVIISPKIYKKEILSKERDGAGKKEREKLENNELDGEIYLFWKANLCIIEGHELTHYWLMGKV